MVISQSLHHVEHPSRVLAEAARVLRPGGSITLIELLPHEERWVQERLGHRHLGFEPEEVRGWLKAAGFTELELDGDVARRGTGFGPPGVKRDGSPDPFRPFLFTARRPEDDT